MKDPDNDKGYTVGIDPKSNDIGSDKTHAVTEDGKASELLESKTQLLQESRIQWYLSILQKMEELNLLKPINLNIHYADGVNLSLVYTLSTKTRCTS